MCWKWLRSDATIHALEIHESQIKHLFFSLTLADKTNNTYIGLTDLTGSVAMEEVGILDAKNRFSELIERVNQTGQAITITNRGEPVAEIAPTRKNRTCSMTRDEAFAQVARLWKTVEPMAKEEIKRTLEEGRDRCLDV